MKIPRCYRVSLLAWFCLLSPLIASTLAQGQILPVDTAQQEAAPAQPQDSLGRSTPRGTVEGFIKAVSDENYAKAARFLDTEDLPSARQGPALARALQQLLDHQGHIMPYSWISEDTTGYADDNLPPALERVGTADVNGETISLLLERQTEAAGNPVWRFSSQTLQEVPLNLETDTTRSLVARVLPSFLKQHKWGGVPIGHWLVMLVLAVLAYLLAWGITAALLGLLHISWHKAQEERTAGIIKAFSLPIRLYLAVWLFMISSREVGVSIIVRQQFSQLTTIVGLVAFLLLLWQLIDFVTHFSEKQMTRRGNLAGLSAVLFLRRGAKIGLVAFGIIVILDTLGFDVTTGIAALGIGGIALALGAQKTVENFVGSVTLIADQPVRVGDFCKVGDTIGTVEQIGMRSTRIRTLDRTIVTIPNGEFSSLKIENYAHRDRFWFHPILTLRYETTPDQTRFLLTELKAVLVDHPKVDNSPARVRLIDLAAYSINVEVFAYILAKDYDEFLEVKEDLLLRMMEVVEASGTGFAFPSQTLYLGRDEGVSGLKNQPANANQRHWQESGSR